MVVKLWRRLTLSSVAVVVLSQALPVSLSIVLPLAMAPAALAKSEIFSDISVEKGKEQALKDGKLLLVDFTATWCPPCKQMEEETWPDEDIQSWIKENAIAIQVDVDKNEELMSAMKVDSMPTVVLFSPRRGGKEFGRKSGFLDASELLHWMKKAMGRKTPATTGQSGETTGKPGETTEKPGDAAAPGKAAAEKSDDADEKEAAGDDDNALWEHIGKAHEMQSKLRNAEYLDELVWLWSNVSKDSEHFDDIRMKMVPVEMKILVEKFPSAKNKFADMRAAAEKAENHEDWIVLNGVLGDNALTVAWFDKVKTDPKMREFILNNSSLLEQPLFAACRWADAADYLYPQPLELINKFFKESEKMKKPRPHTEVSKDFDPFPFMITLVYGAYVGAGRDAIAKQIHDECLRLDNSEAMHNTLDKMAKAMETAKAHMSKTTTGKATSASPHKAAASSPSKAASGTPNKAALGTSDKTTHTMSAPAKTKVRLPDWEN